MVRSCSSKFGGMILALWGRDKLAEDSVVEDAGGWGGVTLAYCVDSPATVDAVLAEAAGAGATGCRCSRALSRGVVVQPASSRHARQSIEHCRSWGAAGHQRGVQLQGSGHGGIRSVHSLAGDAAWHRDSWEAASASDSLEDVPPPAFIGRQGGDPP